MIATPGPAWMPWLLVLLPGSFALARFSLLAAGLAPRTVAALTPAMFFVLLVLPTHVASLATGSIHIGATISLVASGLTGYVVLCLRTRLRWPGLAPDGAAIPKEVWMALAVTLAFISVVVFRQNIHDEVQLPSHQSITSQLANGQYPPIHPLFPAAELRYHYGFDVLSALAVLMLRIRVDQAIDLVSLAAWIATFLAAWAMGARLTTSRGALLAALIVCFAGGLPWLGTWVDGNALLQGYEAGTQRVNPPFVGIFFQHPWSVGTPVWCAALLLADSSVTATTRSGWALVILALCVAALALFHIVLFAMFGLAVAIGLAVQYRRTPRQRLWETAAAVIAGGVAATLCHGFFAPRLAPGDGLMGGDLLPAVDGVAGHWLSSVRWHVASFGLLLVLGPIGLFKLLRGVGTRLADRPAPSLCAVMLAASAAIALTIPNVLRNAHTWDIVKFDTVAALSFSWGAAVFIEGMLDRRRRMGVAVLGLLLAPGLLWVSAFWLTRATIVGPISPYLARRYPLDDADARAITWLRLHGGSPCPMVYRRSDAARPYAAWGGLSVPMLENFPKVWGISDTLIRERERFLEQPPTPESLRRQGVVWVVLDDRDVALAAAIVAEMSRGGAELATDLGPIRIYRLLPTSSI
jgi:hypothetical protein